MNTDMLYSLQRVERLAAASKLVRMVQMPVRYVYAIGFRILRYRFGKRGVAKRTMTFFGVPMTVILPASTDIYLTGGKSHNSEIRLAKLLIRQLQAGAVFIDVGAHFGYFALLAARLVGAQGRVVAFEASETTHAVLSANVAAMPVVQAHHLAVSNQQEMISFYEFPVLYNEYNSLDVAQFIKEKWFQESKPKRIDVPAVTLDNFFASSTLVPDIIKIDVEGAELKVIQGATELLRRTKPIVVLEYLSPERHNQDHQQAVTLLRELGYQAKSIATDGALVSCSDLNAYLYAQHVDSDNFAFVKE
ncbi:FkbM family methyltransferase [Hymenobacter defluvii]|uniref:FkbM family methyltransferase n=1 Tax=Hymenobacter defluvii TaxID=2054411 RepID=A0ABS3TA94_9BACT|nr:FkbM family methyltransferase [Hymenobacter defluvii]MBO3270564.1 FkbM family methyltransferase [Hymenobacter defluvii]